MLRLPPSASIATQRAEVVVRVWLFLCFVDGEPFERRAVPLDHLVRTTLGMCVFSVGAKGVVLDD